MNGEGVEENIQEGLVWIAKASNLGHNVRD
jgi:hypothetical protein